MKYNLKIKNQNSGLRPVTRCENSKICNSQQAGFTIVELMVSVIILAIAIGSVYTTYIAQQRSFATQDQLSETQTESKIAFNILINDLRNAGFAYPEDSNPAVDGFSASITPSPGNNGGRDAITLVRGGGEIATLSAPLIIGRNEIYITYTGASRFSIGSPISIDGIDFSVITACTPIGTSTKCEDGPLKSLTLNRGMSKQIPAGRKLHFVAATTYCVVTNSTDPNYLDLRRIYGAVASLSTCTGGNMERIAENIEDIQFAYAVDNDFDGLIDDQNGNFLFDPGDYLNNAFGNIMAVRVSILARTTGDDRSVNPESKPYYSTGYLLEDHTTNVQDKLRRKVWSMEVALRNPR